MVIAMPPFHSPLPLAAHPPALLPPALLPPVLPSPAAPPVGCDTVTVALRHGLEAVDILRLRRRCGSALQGGAGRVVCFLVPAGTAEDWQLPGTSCTKGAAPLPAGDPRWLVPPSGADGTPAATDPRALRSALCEAACTLTAGGLGPF